MDILLLSLDLGSPPSSGNVQDRMHWTQERKLINEWKKRVWIASNGKLFPPPREDELRKVTLIWEASKGDHPDEDNARRAAKRCIIDLLKRRVRRKMPDGSRVEIPGLLPILWDDDVAHCKIEYRPMISKRKNLTVEIRIESTVD